MPADAPPPPAFDAPRPVRPGEELPVDALAALVRARLDRGADEPVAVEQFPGGHSNLTYLVRVGTDEFVLRRPPFGAKAIKAGHDVGREYRVLSRLHPAYPKAPQPLFFCDEAESPFGAPFYLMQRVRGVIVRHKVPAGVDLTPELMRRMCASLVETLAELHALDVQAIGLGDLGKPEGYLARQVQGWVGRYRTAQTDDVPDLETAVAWLEANVPPREAGATLIHNDFKFDNLVLDPADLGRVLAVLDWEMVTVGDPLSDLGTSLAYWAEPGDDDAFRSLAFSLGPRPGSLRRRELVALYAETSGRPAGNVVFYYVLALFKVAVIAQQLFFRYRKGMTADERFALLGFAVAILGRRAAEAIGKGSIDP
jgi:aminoglycoside phosphotransferase (APT) family kinase protein